MNLERRVKKAQARALASLAVFQKAKDELVRSNGELIAVCNFAREDRKRLDAISYTANAELAANADRLTQIEKILG